MSGSILLVASSLCANAMKADLKDNFQFSYVSLSSIFFIVDPPATLPSFLVMTAEDSDDKHRRMARQAAWTYFLALTAFSLAGILIYRLVLSL